jgi:membrane-bound lytic murein transglycosylase D
MILINRSNILMRFFLLSLFLNATLLQGQTTAKQETVSDTTSVVTINHDDPIVAMLDSLANLKIFHNIESRADTSIIRKYNFPPAFVPVYDDSVYAARIQRLSDYSPFDLVYNAHVRSFIELYATRQRGLTERVMGLGQLYFPLFEEQLDRHNIPLELKYLAVIESALNPTARSRAGASGIWQFMYHTGKMYGLNVNSYVDDRCDVRRATIAACEHLVDLYKIYEDWSLVLAAYNAGPGNVNRAIRRAGGVRDYWAIRPYLPQETRNYVPAFIAVTYVLEHAEDHNLYALPPVYSHLDVDTVVVASQLNLQHVSKLLDIPMDHLRYLNPAFRKNIIPNNSEKPYVLHLPREKTALFLANETEILNYRTPEQQRHDALLARVEETVVHTVRSGETLGAIARRYNTSVAEIQRMNNLRGTTIRVGQRLTVRGSSGHVAVPVPSSNNVHVVKRGETLTTIAQRYKVTVNNLIEWNNLEGSAIQAGQRLLVRPPSRS